MKLWNLWNYLTCTVDKKIQTYSKKILLYEMEKKSLVGKYFYPTFSPKTSIRVKIDRSHIQKVYRFSMDIGVLLHYFRHHFFLMKENQALKAMLHTYQSSANCLYSSQNVYWELSFCQQRFSRLLIHSFLSRSHFQSLLYVVDFGRTLLGQILYNIFSNFLHDTNYNNIATCDHICSALQKMLTNYYQLQQVQGNENW